MPIRAIIFDRDGVLTQFDFETITAFFNRLLPITPYELVPRLQQWGEVVGFPTDIAEEQIFWHSFCKQLSDELNLTSTTCAQLQGFNYLSVMQMFPETKPVLLDIRQRGLRTGVLSNNPMTAIHSSLVALGLADLIDIACAARINGVTKPHPAAYFSVLQALAVKPEECLFFDDEEHCVKGAYDIGMHAYLVDRSRTNHALCEGIVQNLTAVTAILESLDEPIPLICPI